MARACWSYLAIALIATACRAPSKTPIGETVLTGANGVTPNGPPAAQAERMPHCPNVVPGATTVVAEVPDGIELRITASGTGATEIRKRASHLASAADETRGKHRATGEGGGQFGRCPVVMRNTRLEVQEVPGGAAIVIRPSDPLELDWLRREVQARSAQLAAPRAFGQGLMKACPNAVPNAVTRVVDTPHGVDLKVTSPAPDATKAIRERAKELAARRTPPLDERCPASAPDANVYVSDAPDGVTISIRAKNPKDVPLLRHAVRERARDYAAPLVR